jgi:type IX secretion system PorP/SprF family membrane protein
MRKLFLYLVAAIALPVLVNGQDPHWSMIQWNPVYLNPAFSGFAKKANRITGIYRDQWRAIAVPYSTTHISYDRRVVFNEEKGIRFGLGGQFLYDKAGDGALSTFRPGLNAAFGKYFNSSKQLVHIGVTGAYTLKQVDFNKLTFDNQYDGTQFDPTINPGEQFESNNAGYFDLGAGFNFNSKLKESGDIDVGVSAFNLTQPSYSFLNTSEAEPGTRIMAYTKANIKLGKSAWEFQPAFFYQNQKKAQEYLFQSLFSVRVSSPADENKDVRLTFGPGYRLDDAVIGYVGMNWNDLRVAFAFDGNVSDFRQATNGRGAYELTLNYEWEKKKKKPEYVIDTVTVEEPEEEIEEEEVTEELFEEVIEEVEIETPVDPVAVLLKAVEEAEKQLSLLLPVQLFFDNDQPNPRSSATTTTFTYEQLLGEYLERRSAFVEKHDEDANAFFNENVSKGYRDLNAALNSMELLLENGKSVTIRVKGFASPLASATYNETLSARRIASVVNYMKLWRGGNLAGFITDGRLVVETVPMGERTAPAGISDSRQDLRNSVYSRAASYERRVEIIGISVE